MNATMCQITSLTMVYSTVYSGADQRKHLSSVSLAFMRGNHRWPVNSSYKRPVTRKMFLFDDVIMWYNVSHMLSPVCLCNGLYKIDDDDDAAKRFVYIPQNSFPFLHNAREWKNIPKYSRNSRKPMCIIFCTPNTWYWMMVLLLVLTGWQIILKDYIIFTSTCPGSRHYIASNGHGLKNAYVE